MKFYPDRLNRAYDRLPEPTRFFVAAAVISPAFLLGTLPFWWDMAALLYCGALGVLRAAYLVSPHP